MKRVKDQENRHRLETDAAGSSMRYSREKHVVSEVGLDIHVPHS